MKTISALLTGLKTVGPMLLGVCLSGGLLFLAMRSVDLRQVGDSLADVRLIWIPVMVAALMGDLTLRAIRWRLLLSGASPRVKTWPLFKLESVGLGINNVLFLRVGEVVRVFLASQELGVGLLAVFASVVIERMLDMLFICLLYGIASQFYAGPLPPELGRMALLSAVGVAVILWGMAAAEGFWETHPWVSGLKKHPRLYGFIQQAALGARALRSWKVAGEASVLSLGLWCSDAVMYWAGAHAMGLGDVIGFGVSISLLATAAAASFLPAVPGAFGVYEQIIKSVLMGFGVDGPVALAYAGFVHVVNYVAITGLGIIFLYVEGHSIAAIKAIGRAGLREDAR